MWFRNLILSVLVLLAISFSCMPERSYIEDSDAALVFTLDTVFFDTVFTTVGTVTKSFRVKNPHNKFVKIKEISLAGGGSSFFRLNVDGTSGIMFSGNEIAPHDSMYVFVEATLGENSSDDILRIQDSIVFVTNGNTQDVDLVAWGQDVNIFSRDSIHNSTTWTADKPYLIKDWIVIDADQTLTIEPGTRIYLHRDAYFIVDGTIQADGTLEEPILFKGDRLEKFYDDLPGQWGLIYFSDTSRNNSLNYVNVLGSTIGILISAPPEDGNPPDLRITNSTINHVSSFGLYALNASVYGENLVIGECGGSNVALFFAGSYEFIHCTFANYWRSFFSNRRLPALYIADYFIDIDSLGEQVLYVNENNFEKAEFKNTIIYGNERHELVLDSYLDAKMNYFFDHCLTRIDKEEYDYTQDPQFNFTINNYDPLLDSVPYSYQLDTLSPAIDAGLLEHAILVPFDQNGESRVSDAGPDIGAYERIEE